MFSFNNNLASLSIIFSFNANVALILVVSDFKDNAVLISSLEYVLELIVTVELFDVKDNGYSLFHGKIGKLILSADTQTIPNATFYPGNGLACVIRATRAWTLPFAPQSGIVSVTVYVSFTS